MFFKPYFPHNNLLQISPPIGLNIFENPHFFPLETRATFGKAESQYIYILRVTSPHTINKPFCFLSAITAGLSLF